MGPQAAVQIMPAFAQRARPLWAPVALLTLMLAVIERAAGDVVVSMTVTGVSTTAAYCAGTSRVLPWQPTWCAAYVCGASHSLLPQVHLGRHPGPSSLANLLLLHDVPRRRMRTECRRLPQRTRRKLGAAHFRHKRHAVSRKPVLRQPRVPEPLRQRGRCAQRPRHPHARRRRRHRHRRAARALRPAGAPFAAAVLGNC
jgi:hypothetical protein